MIAVRPLGHTAFLFIRVPSLDPNGHGRAHATPPDGVPWSRIEGRGTYRASMEAVSTLQQMRFDKGGYVRVVAIVRSLDKDKVLPRVDTLAASIAPK